MSIKILCIEYILWGIPTIEYTFDVAHMMKTATVKDVPINNDAHEAMQATRINNDNEFVKQLLQHIEVNTTPVKIMRLGRYKQPEAGNDMKPRALKVILDSHANQQKIMDNAKYLKDAPAHLKAVSICYDLTEEERNKTKTLMEEAQEK